MDAENTDPHVPATCSLCVVLQSTRGPRMLQEEIPPLVSGFGLEGVEGSGLRILGLGRGLASQRSKCSNVGRLENSRAVETITLDAQKSNSWGTYTPQVCMAVSKCCGQLPPRLEVLHGLAGP